MKYLLSIDPGMKGALAWLDNNGNLIRVVDMPVVNKEISVALLWQLGQELRPDAIVVEYQQAMPDKLRGRTQGGQSTFKTGKGYGIVLAVYAGLEVPMTVRRSSAWKPRLGLSKDKELSRARAIELWPSMADRFKFKVNEGRAEAALLGLSMLVEQGKPPHPVSNSVPRPKKRIVRVP